MKFAELVFPQKISEDRHKQTLTYAIPPDLDIQVGQLVGVRLRNRPTNALVFAIHKEEPSFKTVPISEILTPDPLLSPNQIALINWMHAYYFTPLSSLIKTFIPDRVFKNKPIKTNLKEKTVPAPLPPKTLNAEQQAAVDQVISSAEKTFLIQGITGSGKTEVYTKISDHYLKQDGQVLILVPEISLTPQTIEYFERTLQIKAAALHSKLSEGEKYREWQAIKKGEKRLIIGSRSAIFAPFQNLQLVIVDEEHENCYKQDTSPRYTVHKLLEISQSLQPNLKVVYASATPKIETAHELAHSTIYLKERINKGELPTIEIVDLRDEFHRKNTSIFSERLQEAIRASLARKEQVLLFLNRRGSASSVVCRDCGHVQSCANCESRLTYHPNTYSAEKLICHHCGVISPPPLTCPQCQGPNIRYLGIGTQKVQSEAEKMFPEAKILRADQDTTGGKEDFETIYQAFKNHEADILVGTQMIAKGLHLPKVSLVGVILADIGLNIGNYNTDEKNFQLLTQVAGRAGRADTEGRVIIQTYNPGHIALTTAASHNFDQFYQYELHQRQMLNYPPFGRLIKLLFEDADQAKIQRALTKIEDLLWHHARELDIAKKLEINAFPSYILRLRGKYRYNILIKSLDPFLNFHPLLEKILEDATITMKFKIDPDPVNTN